MDTQKLQILSWLLAPVTLAVTLIIHRNNLKMFLLKWWKALALFTFVTLLVAAYFNGRLAWLVRTVALPIWVWLLLVPAAIVLVISCLLAWCKPSTKEPLATDEPLAPDPLRYTEADIFGARWHWRYINRRIDNESLAAFCPKSHCKNRLELQDDCDRMDLERHGIPVKLVCLHCGFCKPFDFAKHDLLNRVGQEIERRLNTGEYVRELTG
jgi:hypothetical protein